MRRITTLIKGGILQNDALPLAARQSALPFIVASLPVVISSLLGAYVVMPLVVALTAYQLFLLTKRTDGFMFALTKMRSRVAITMPLCGFISAWGLALALLDRRSMMNGVVGPYCILILIACAPAFRWRAARTARYLPLWLSFSLAGALALAAATAYAF